MSDAPPRRRAGGRNARVALRSAPPADDARAIWPGMSSGAYRPLTDQQMEQVLDASFRLLEEIGMGQATPEAGHLRHWTRCRNPRQREPARPHGCRA